MNPTDPQTSQMPENVRLAVEAAATYINTANKVWLRDKATLAAEEIASVMIAHLRYVWPRPKETEPNTLEKGFATGSSRPALQTASHCDAASSVSEAETPDRKTEHAALLPQPASQEGQTVEK
jgi:hypothetical protein